MGMPIEEPISLVKEDVQINPQLLTDQINTDNRTEVKVLEKKKQLLQYNVKATQAAYYPTLSLIGNYAWQGFIINSRLAKVKVRSLLVRLCISRFIT